MIEGGGVGSLVYWTGDDTCSGVGLSKEGMMATEIILKSGEKLGLHGDWKKT